MKIFRYDLEQTIIANGSRVTRFEFRYEGCNMGCNRGSNNPNPWKSLSSREALYLTENVLLKAEHTSWLHLEDFSLQLQSYSLIFIYQSINPFVTPKRCAPPKEPIKVCLRRLPRQWQFWCTRRMTEKHANTRKQRNVEPKENAQNRKSERAHRTAGEGCAVR